MKFLRRFTNKGKCKGTMENLVIMCSIYFRLWQSDPTICRIRYGKIFLKLHRYYCAYMTRSLK